MRKKIFTTEDRQQLLRCEEIIRNDRRDDLQLGEALATVCNERLYLINHPSFDAFCRDVLKKSKRHAYRLIKAKTESNRLKAEGIKLDREGPIRVLLKEREAAQRTKAVEQAISAGRGKITMQDLEEILQSLRNHENTTPEEVIESAVEFELERYLEEFIVANFETVFGGRLHIYRSPDTGEYGQ